VHAIERADEGLPEAMLSRRPGNEGRKTRNEYTDTRQKKKEEQDGKKKLRNPSGGFLDEKRSEAIRGEK